MVLLDAVLLMNGEHYTIKIPRGDFEEMLKSKDCKIIGKPSLTCIGDKDAKLYTIQYKKEFRILVYDAI